MSLPYERSTHRDPDGLRPAPRTLRDAQRDPRDWIESPQTAASNDAALFVDDEPAVRDPPPPLKGAVIAVLVALVVLVVLGFALRA